MKKTRTSKTFLKDPKDPWGLPDYHFEDCFSIALLICGNVNQMVSNFLIFKKSRDLDM